MSEGGESGEKPKRAYTFGELVRYEREHGKMPDDMDDETASAIQRTTDSFAKMAESVVGPRLNSILGSQATLARIAEPDWLKNRPSVMDPDHVERLMRPVPVVRPEHIRELIDESNRIHSEQMDFFAAEADRARADLAQERTERKAQAEKAKTYNSRMFWVAVAGVAFGLIGVIVAIITLAGQH